MKNLFEQLGVGSVENQTQKYKSNYFSHLWIFQKTIIPKLIMTSKTGKTSPKGCRLIQNRSINRPSSCLDDDDDGGSYTTVFIYYIIFPLACVPWENYFKSIFIIGRIIFCSIYIFNN